MIPSSQPCSTEHKTGENKNMTYITEEKRVIAELRHKSKMATLDLIAKAEGEYNRATTTHKSTLDRKIAEYELKAKNALKLDIKNARVSIRGDEVDIDGVDNDE
jgi:hypothetical protein